MASEREGLFVICYCARQGASCRGVGVNSSPRRVVPHRLPQERKEAVLVYFGLVRAYWRLARAARHSQCCDKAREAIELDALDALADAGAACGTVSEQTVAKARQILKEIFDDARARLH
jgi:hypothetical protein